MGFRYYKRVNYGNGLGLNLSKSGVSPSMRTKWGSFGSKSYSIRSGIPGLSFRGGSGKNSGLIWLIIMFIWGAIVLLYNMIIGLVNLVIIIIGSIFDDDGGINYTSLIILLSSILLILLVLYFNLPGK